MTVFLVIIGIYLLLAALGGSDSISYELLRWVICASAIFVAWKLNEWKKSGWVAAFTIIAIIFNPILPFYLGKGLWMVMDVVAAVLFFTVISLQSDEPVGSNVKKRTP